MHQPNQSYKKWPSVKMRPRSSSTLFALLIFVSVKAEFSPFDIVDEYVKQFRSGIGNLCKWSDNYSYQERNYDKSEFNATLALGGAEEYDFIIVGGGTAGLTLAHRLSEEPRWRTLVLEAGGLETTVTEVPAMQPQLQTTAYTWGYKTCAQKHACLGSVGNMCSVVKGKAVGGDTAINDMLYTRGHPRDYDLWADTGMKGWCWDNVLPYFKNMEDACVEDMDRKFRHYGGPIHLENLYPSDPILAEHFLKAGLESGLERIDYNGKEHLGLGLPQVITKHGKRHSVAKAYLKPIKDRKNLELSPYSQVIEVLVSPITKEAHGVTYVHDGKVFIAKATKEVILAAGAINTPQLLMLSGIGRKSDLEHFGIHPVADLAVGKSLKDQVSFVGLNFVYDPLHEKHAIQHGILTVQTDLSSQSVGEGQSSKNEGRPQIKEDHHHVKEEHHHEKEEHHHEKEEHHHDKEDHHHVKEDNHHDKGDHYHKEDYHQVKEEHHHKEDYHNVKEDTHHHPDSYHHVKDPAIELVNVLEIKEKRPPINLDIRYETKDHTFIPQIGVSYEQELLQRKEETIKQESEMHWVNDHSDEDIIKYLRYGKGPLSTTGLQLIGYVKTEFSRDKTDYPDVQLLIKKTHPKGGCYHFNGANLRKDLKDIFCKPYEGFNVEIVLLHPKSKGFIKLNDVDPYHQPYINPMALSDEDEYDVSTLMAGIRKVLNMMNGPAMQKLGVKLVKEKIPNVIKLSSTMSIGNVPSNICLWSEDK
ncbi:uncharacterized protein [Diabrotica undecimpunctata]|uniref:uncharacterized protein n=1 Tax=Diabrotica undecimpunctata TaxID=50387 RepID=UPI003B6359C4